MTQLFWGTKEKGVCCTSHLMLAGEAWDASPRGQVRVDRGLWEKACLKGVGFLIFLVDSVTSCGMTSCLACTHLSSGSGSACAEKFQAFGHCEPMLQCAQAPGSAEGASRCCEVPTQFSIAHGSSLGFVALSCQHAYATVLL